MTPFIKEYVGTVDWEPLEVTSKGFAGNVVAAIGNASALEIRVGTGVGSTLVATEFFPLQACDLASIQIKGDGLVLKVFGVTSTGW